MDVMLTLPSKAHFGVCNLQEARASSWTPHPEARAISLLSRGGTEVEGEWQKRAGFPSQLSPLPQVQVCFRLESWGIGLERQPLVQYPLPFLASVQFSSVQSLSHVRLFATPCTAALQASLSFTNSWSLLKLMSMFDCFQFTLIHGLMFQGPMQYCSSQHWIYRSESSLVNTDHLSIPLQCLWTSLV